MNLELLRELSTERRESLDRLKKKASDSVENASGTYSGAVSDAVRFLAVADYLLQHDIVRSHEGLAESARTYLSVFERFDAGESISPSYVSMRAYRKLFDALASGSENLAETMALHIGGREKIEREHNRPFDIALGYALKNVILGDEVEAAKRVDELVALCGKKADINFVGYSTVLAAVLSRDMSAASKGFEQLIAGHQRLSKGSGLFKNTEDELLCVWGIGLANLCRMRGLMVVPNHPLIPSDMLIEK